MSSVLSIIDLAFGYPGQAAVLEAISFKVHRGERVGLIGPNGAGKTTLFLLICGIVSAKLGTIEIGGFPVLKGRFNPAVGMVFQHTADQLICPSVREDVAFGPQNMGLPVEEVAANVDLAAGATGITPLFDRVPHQLSSGEQRLVALAGVLAMQPELLILDEPTADLDMRYRRRLVGMLKDMEQKTMLTASHDLEFILEVCTRVMVLDQGKIQADGEPATVMANCCLMEDHGLEVPHSLTAAWHRHGSETNCSPIAESYKRK
ncbi:MAG: ABC transporter ATP-binding protein [Firmicutes bacterium]|nr:ABC transporter ATP-binding protein [Bacillota bacterium]